MNYPIKIAFTPTEFSVLQDRLEVGECIADALEGTLDDLPIAAGRDEIINSAICMTGPVITLSDDLDLAVLQDAIEGSTVPAKAADALEFGRAADYRWANSVRRSFKTIEAKFEAATGVSAIFPKY